MKAKKLRKAWRGRDDVLHLRRGDTGASVCGGPTRELKATDAMLLDLPTCTACCRDLATEHETTTQALIDLANDVAQHWQHTRERAHLSALALFDRTTLKLETLERLGLIERAES